MFTWSYTEVVQTNASPKQVWCLWSAAENWPQWDNELEWVKLHKSFSKGSTGTMKPKNGPVVSFEITSIKENQQFISCAKLPLTKMSFIHAYEKQPDGSNCIVHTVEMRGLLSPIFGRIIGNKIKKHLRAAMLKLSDHATEQ